MINTKLDVLGNLNDCLQTDEIDLVILNTASLPVRMQVLKNKKIIVDKRPFLRHRFESQAIRTYLDFSYLETAILKRRYYGR